MTFAPLDTSRSDLDIWLRAKKSPAGAGLQNVSLKRDEEDTAKLELG